MHKYLQLIYSNIITRLFVAAPPHFNVIAILDSKSLYHKLQGQRIGIQTKSGEGVSSFTSCHSVTFHGVYH